MLSPTDASYAASALSPYSSHGGASGFQPLMPAGKAGAAAAAAAVEWPSGGASRAATPTHLGGMHAHQHQSHHLHLAQQQQQQQQPLHPHHVIATASASRPSSRNSDARSGFTYAEMIREAITSSSSGQMFLYQIYDYLQTHFACFRNAVDQNWKNSVRHSLSINPLFKRVEPAGGAGVTCTGSKRKATAGLWTMRTYAKYADVPRPSTLAKRKVDEDWVVSPPARTKSVVLVDGMGMNMGGAAGAGCGPGGAGAMMMMGGMGLDSGAARASSSATSSPATVPGSGLGSGTASPVEKHAMEDRDVAELLMALASGHYLAPVSAGASVPSTPSPTPGTLVLR